MNWLIVWLITASVVTPESTVSAWCWHSRRPSAPCLPPLVPMDGGLSSTNESVDVCCWCFWIERLLSGNTVCQSVLPLHKQRRHIWGCAYKTCLPRRSFRTSLLLMSPSEIMKADQHWARLAPPTPHNGFISGGKSENKCRLCCNVTVIDCFRVHIEDFRWLCWCFPSAACTNVLG